MPHLGELSAARQSLTSSALAPGTPETLQALCDPDRRPAEPYEALSHEVLDFQPDQVHAPVRAKGAAPEPSGLTAEVACVLLDDEGSSDLFVRVKQLVAQAAVPRDAARALGLGRVVALQKPNGRVRGIVIGDFTRRLVARCFAQEACSPFQFALSTRSGAESVVHVLTAALELDPESTRIWNLSGRVPPALGQPGAPEASC